MNIRNHYSIQFLYYTNCINLSIRFVYPSVWRKKIRSSKERIWILMSGPPVENRNTFVSQKRMQKYCFFLTWPNIFEKKCKKKCIFFVTCWKSAYLIFGFYCLFFAFLAKSRYFEGFASRTYMRYAYIRNAHARVYKGGTALKSPKKHQKPPPKERLLTI